LPVPHSRPTVLVCRHTECVVFEDSFNGIKSGASAGMFTVGLATTNSPEAIAPLCDVVIKDFTEV